MNRIETLKIVGTLRESYPNGAEVTENTIDLWTALLEPYEYEKDGKKYSGYEFNIELDWPEKKKKKE